MSTNEPVRIRSSRTMLLISFSIPQGMNRSQWIEEMIERELPNLKTDGGRSSRLWERRDSSLLPDELRELDPAIRGAFTPSKGDSGKGPALFSVNHSFLQRYQEVFITWGNAGYQGKILGVSAILLPHASGLLALELEFPAVETLGSYSKLLFAIRHLDAKGKNGWLFGQLSQREVSLAYQNSMGPLFASLKHPLAEGVDRIPCSLRLFAEWLLGGNTGVWSESTSTTHTTSFVTQTRYGVHQTAITLSAPLPDALLSPIIWRLQRAYSDKYLPGELNEKTDVLLRPRGNRVIGISREGVASVSWETSTSGSEFETSQWLPKMFGVYLWLSIHTISEMAALARIGGQLQDFGGVLAGRECDLGRASLDCQRVELKGLVKSATATVLKLTGPDCGGISEYQQFFQAARSVRMIEERRDEIRQGLRELNAIIEEEHQDKASLRQRKVGFGLGVASFFLIPFTVAQTIGVVYPELFIRAGGLSTIERSSWFGALFLLSGALLGGLVVIARRD